MQGTIVRTMRSLYDVGQGELGVVCGMYFTGDGYAVSIRFSTPDGPLPSATYTLDFLDYQDAVYEFGKVA